MLVGMGEDFDDTIIVPSRPDDRPAGHAIEDTIISQRGLREIRIPDAALADADVVPAPDPEPSTAHFALRIGLGGHLVALDVPCYIGRNPHPPRIARETPPRLVRVPSPAREVSSTHLEVREVGTAVVVTDLRSTNGTSVLTPGASPRTLRQGESVVVPAGTLLNLGDDNVLQVVALAVPPSSERAAS